MQTEDSDIYADFFKKVPEMLFIVDLDGRFKKVNPAVEKTVGFTAAGMLDKTPVGFVHPDDLAAAEAALKKVLAGESRVSIEARCRCKDGSYKWLRLHGALDTEKKLIHVAASDITANKTTAAALRESADTLRKIMGLAPMSMAIVGMDGTIEYINRKAVQTFGYLHENIPTMDRWWEQAYPDEAYRKDVIARYMGHVYEAIKKNGEVDGDEYVVTCKDGKKKTCFIYGAIVAGKVFVMFDDITRRSDAEKLLRESESRYRSLVETTRTGYVIINKEGRVLDANTEYVRLTGRPDLKEVLGRNVLEWTAPYDKEKNAAAVAQCAKDGYILDFDVDYTAPSGKILPVEVNATVIQKGGVPQIMTLCRDISRRRRNEADIKELNQSLEQRVAERTLALTAANAELKAEITQRLKAEQARNQMQEQLFQSQKLEAVGRLAGGIAHDFNNILGSISGYAEFLLDAAPQGAPSRGDLAEIMLETEKGSALTHQLLAFSAKQEFRLEVVDINKVAADHERMLGRIVGANMRLETRLAADLRRVKADPSQLSQVIMNLVINARDAMPDGGLIIMETRNAELGADGNKISLCPPPGRYVELSVSDMGVGMAPETVKHIFEPFYTTKKPGQGRGLGLATVYGILSRSGGGIAVESSPGQGTKFRVYFPCNGAD